jgi:exosortase/archaeosortase family protein
MKKLHLKLPEKLQPYRGVILFAVVLLLSNFFWKYNVLGDESANINSTITFWGLNITFPFSWMAHHVASVTKSIMQFFGSEVKLGADNTLSFPNGNSVLLIWACTGIKQAFICFCIFLFSRGPWIEKLWYIPFSLVVVYLFNILRVIIITICIENHPEQFDFIHHYLLKYLFYGVIFLLWVFWEEKIAGKRISSTSSISDN